MAGVAAAVAAEREGVAQVPVQQRLPAGLSAREAQVLRLVAVGRSNREIAQALFVSPNTVANHVRSILGKTGSANRTEAAAFAMRNLPTSV
jgi:DNA-binding CsgD family transcriptional regulator